MIGAPGPVGQFPARDRGPARPEGPAAKGARLNSEGGRREVGEGRRSGRSRDRSTTGVEPSRIGRSRQGRGSRGGAARSRRPPRPCRSPRSRGRTRADRLARGKGDGSPGLDGASRRERPLRRLDDRPRPEPGLGRSSLRGGRSGLARASSSTRPPGPGGSRGLDHPSTPYPTAARNSIRRDRDAGGCRPRFWRFGPTCGRCRVFEAQPVGPRPSVESTTRPPPGIGATREPLATETSELVGLEDSAPPAFLKIRIRKRHPTATAPS